MSTTSRDDALTACQVRKLCPFRRPQRTLTCSDGVCATGPGRGGLGALLGVTEPLVSKQDVGAGGLGVPLKPKWPLQTPAPPTSCAAKSEQDFAHRLGQIRPNLPLMKDY